MGYRLGCNCHCRSINYFIKHILLSPPLFDSIFFSDCQSDNEVSSPQQLFSLMYVMYDNVRGDDCNLAENFTFSVSFNHLARAQTKNWTSLRYFFVLNCGMTLPKQTLYVYIPMPLATSGSFWIY